MGIFTGRGVGVAIIDSGIDNLQDFDRRISAFYLPRARARRRSLLTTTVTERTSPGLIGSSGKQTGGLWQGVAPNVNFIGLKVLDKTGSGVTSDVITAIQFATVNRKALGIDIINLSLGHPILESAATDPLVQAVEAAVRAGITVVVAAGNYGTSPTSGSVGYAGIASPGNAPSAITVGSAKTFGTAIRSDDRVADYSSRGPSWSDGFGKPDVVAPGNRLVSDMTNGTLWTGHPEWQAAAPPGGSGKWMQLSGTSMAAGVATGVAALAIEASRAVNPYGPRSPPMR